MRLNDRFLHSRNDGQCCAMCNRIRAGLMGEATQKSPLQLIPVSSAWRTYQKRCLLSIFSAWYRWSYWGNSNMTLMNRKTVVTALLLLAITSTSCGSLSKVFPSMSSLPSADEDVWQHAIAASGSTVHLLWGASDILYRQSTDEGLTLRLT